MKLVRGLVAAAATLCLGLVGVQALGTDCPVNVQNDIALLNFALTLEHQDSAFFSRVVGTGGFTAAQFQSAGYTMGDYNYFQLILAHEQAHAGIISDAITRLGGTPVPPCTYSFPITDVASAVSLAQFLENVGVTAYDGGVNGLSNPDLQVAAASIATVEARHAGYLNSLRGSPYFPNATDMPRTAPEVAALVAPFIVGCSYAWNDTSRLPAIRPNGVSYVTTPIITTPPAPGTYTAAQASNDIDTLNYALTLEQLEAAFYQQGLANGNLDEAAFTAANRTAQRTQLLLIRDHEAAHVTALTNTITSRGGTARTPCTYDFSAAFTNVTAFLQTAAILEQVGVSAYDFAIKFIADTGLQTIAATIATVEARHSAYLYSVTGMQPFTNATDATLSPMVVLQNAAPFISSCPQGLPTTPIVAPNSDTACPSPRASKPTSPSCGLSSLAISGISLSPSFSSSNANGPYTCTLSSNASSTVAVTVGSAQSGARLTAYPLASSLAGMSYPLTSGVQSPNFPLGSIGASTGGVRLNVAVPSVLFALGDSVTFGETDLVYVPMNGTTRGYPRLIADYIDSVNGAAPRPDIYNFAIDGETAPSFLSGTGRLPPVTGRTDAILAQQNTNYQGQSGTAQADKLQAVNTLVTAAGQTVQAAFITLGFNDLARIATSADPTAVAMQRISDFRSEYRAVLRRVRTILPTADLYMLGYYNPFPANPTNPAYPLFAMYGGMLNAVVAELSLEFDAFFVEAYRPFLGREAELTYLGALPAGSTISGNNGGTAPLGNVHANEAGYRVIADQFIARLNLNGTLAGGCSADYTFCSSTISPSSSGGGTPVGPNAASATSSGLALLLAVVAAALLQMKQ